KDDIENSKCKCPQYNTKLSTLLKSNKKLNKKYLRKRIYPNLYITQIYESQNNVNTSNILVPDSLPINPNSIYNVQKVLDHIKEISRINKTRTRHKDYIKKKLNSKKTLITQPISITVDEEQIQLAENSIKKEELILVIESLIGFLNKINRPQFKSLKAKKKEELLIILQQLRDLTSDNKID
ncbi:6914_t:CDS:2, partial [Dentiscutata heterogama]